LASCCVAAEGGQRNLPSRRAVVNVVHACGGMIRALPVGFLESRTATVPAVTATSMQLA
jgi:hypothetical protein